jgi:hypothetical protein
LIFFVKIHHLKQNQLNDNNTYEKNMINDILVSYYLRQLNNINFLNIFDWYIIQLTNQMKLFFFNIKNKPATLKFPEFTYINHYNANENFQYRLFEDKGGKAFSNDLLVDSKWNILKYQLLTTLIALETAYFKLGFIHNNLYIKGHAITDSVTFKRISYIDKKNLCFKRIENDNIYRFDDHDNSIIKISNFEKSRIKQLNKDMKEQSPSYDQKTLIGSILQNLKIEKIESFNRNDKNRSKWMLFLEFCSNVLGFGEDKLNDIDDYSQYDPLLKIIGIDVLNELNVNHLIGLNYNDKWNDEYQELLNKILYKRPYGLNLNDCINHLFFVEFISENKVINNKVDILITDVL